MFRRPNQFGPIDSLASVARSLRFVVPLLFVFIGSVLNPALVIAAPDEGVGAASGRLFYCDVPLEASVSGSEIAQERERMRLDAALDAYHGLAFMAGGGVLSIAAEPTRRWSGNNGFDDAWRGGLRGSNSDARKALDTAGDLGLALGVGILPFATIGAKYFRTHDCLETWDMTTDWIESFGLTLFITQSTKLVAGRTRPYTEACDSSPARDARCGADDRFMSFFSGHTSFAAAGAGLTCAFSLKREAWGSSASARYAPCALGVTTAVATGLLRVAADR
ncbi:MAG: phosphatase PAP2 family protein, partial [Myxococcota bacterium]